MQEQSATVARAKGNTAEQTTLKQTHKFWRVPEED